MLEQMNQGRKEVKEATREILDIMRSAGDCRSMSRSEPHEIMEQMYLLIKRVSSTGLTMPVWRVCRPKEPRVHTFVATCNVGMVVIASPLIAPLPLNMPADCHVASQCATLLFIPSSCSVILPPPRPVNAPACCCHASHCATFSVAPAVHCDHAATIAVSHCVVVSQP